MNIQSLSIIFGTHCLKAGHPNLSEERNHWKLTQIEEDKLLLIFVEIKVAQEYFLKFEMRGKGLQCGRIELFWFCSEKVCLKCVNLLIMGFDGLVLENF